MEFETLDWTTIPGSLRAIRSATLFALEALFLVTTKPNYCSARNRKADANANARRRSRRNMTRKPEREAQRNQHEDRKTRPRKLLCPFHFANAERAKWLTIVLRSPAHITEPFPASPANRGDRIARCRRQAARTSPPVTTSGTICRRASCLPPSGAARVAEPRLASCFHLGIDCDLSEEFDPRREAARIARTGRASRVAVKAANLTACAAAERSASWLA